MRGISKTTIYSSLRSVWAALPALLIGGGACSVINSFGDVVTSDGGAGARQDGGSGGHPITHDGGVDGGGSTGLVVVAATLLKDGGTPESTSAGLVHVLSVIDPATGKELPKGRSSLAAQAVAYDGATDLWYIFEAAGVLSSGTHVTLHVGKIDGTTGAFTELSSVSSADGGIPPLLDPNLIAVLNDRLAYATEDGAGNVQVAVLDTSAPAKVVPAKFGGTYDPQVAGQVAYFLGTRDADLANQGGQIDVLSDSCTAPADGGSGTCDLLKATARIYNDSTINPAVTPSGSAVATAPKPTNGHAWAACKQEVYPQGANGLDVIASTPLFGERQALVHRLIPGAAAGTPPADVPFAMTFSSAVPPQKITALAVAECQGVLLAAENQSSSLFAVPLDGTTGASFTFSGSSPNTIAFEPQTGSILVPFQTAPYAFHAYRLAPSPIALVERTASTWAPPADLWVNSIAVKRPFPMVCAQ